MLSRFAARFVSLTWKASPFQHYPWFFRDRAQEHAKLPHVAPWPAIANMTQAGFRMQLATLRRHAATARIPFWIILNSMPYAGHADPTEAELRFQAFTALAHGASGVAYFCYWDPAETAPGDWTLALGGSIIQAKARANGEIVHTRGPHFEQVRRINSVLRVFGELLLNATSTGVFTAFDSNSSVLPAESAIATVNGSGVGEGIQFLAGQFALGQNRTALLLTNQDAMATLWASVTFRAPWNDWGRVMEVDPATGQQAALLDDSPSTPGLQLALEAGGARLLVFPSIDRNTPRGAGQ